MVEQSHHAERVRAMLCESARVKQELAEQAAGTIARAASLLIDAFRNGGKVLLFGNGGSAADAQHLVAELVGRFREERRALAGIALTADTATLTALGNDYGYDRVLERQILGLGCPGDVFIQSRLPVAPRTSWGRSRRRGGDGWSLSA